MLLHNVISILGMCNVVSLLNTLDLRSEVQISIREKDISRLLFYQHLLADPAIKLRTHLMEISEGEELDWQTTLMCSRKENDITNISYPWLP